MSNCNKMIQIKSLLRHFVPIEIVNKILFECKGFITPSARAMKQLIKIVHINQQTVSIISPQLYTVSMEVKGQEKKKKKMRFFTRDEKYRLKFMYDDSDLFMLNV